MGKINVLASLDLDAKYSSAYFHQLPDLTRAKLLGAGRDSWQTWYDSPLVESPIK